MEEGTTEHLFVPQVQTLLHYILGWLLFSSYVLVFYSESLERNDIPCTSGYKTSCPFNFNLMEIHSTEFTPVGLTFKMVMCDQPKRHHKGKFLKEENVLVYYLGFRKKWSDMMVLSQVCEGTSTCGVSSRLTLAGRGGEDEGGVLVTTCSGPLCGFTV